MLPPISGTGGSDGDRPAPTADGEGGGAEEADGQREGVEDEADRHRLAGGDTERAEEQHERPFPDAEPVERQGQHLGDGHHRREGQQGHDRQVEPDSLTSALAKRLRELGVQVCEYTRVLDFEQTGSAHKQFACLGRGQGFTDDFGHVEMLVSKAAHLEVWPLVARWLKDQQAPLLAGQPPLAEAGWGEGSDKGISLLSACG